MTGGRKAQQGRAARRSIAVLVVAVCVAATAASPAPASAITSLPAANPKPVLTLLRSLPVVPEHTRGYSRELFADWYDADGDGCDTREEVLIAERVRGTVRGCTVVGGLWSSRYDGAVTRNPSSFDIDHRVALKEAWDSGAWRWSRATRDAFANDLAFAPSLIAVSASANRSKGDQDPAEWLPPDRSEWCHYARQWVAVKYRWRLAVDPAERSTLSRILSGCRSLIPVPPLAPRR